MHGRPARIITEDHIAFNSVCLDCPDTPCMKLSRQEAVHEVIPGFPSDDLLLVCPTNALDIDDNGHVVIDNDLCILCGACTTRCPVGAIYYDDEFGFIINREISDKYHSCSQPAPEFITWRTNTFRSCEIEGTFIIESDIIIGDYSERFIRIKPSLGDKFPNILARNLLLAHGIKAAMTRRGNNFMRMDIVFATGSGSKGVAEVEFGQSANLDAPRDLLDSMSVVVSRYQWTLDSVIPLVITDELPNRRSEYWAIMQDIRNVTGVEGYTITVFLLSVLLWNNIKLLLPNACLYVDRDSISYRTQVIETLLERKLNLNGQPNSLIDISK